MTTDSHLSSLYTQAQIILWVEDPITRDYLKELWEGAQEIRFFIAGGHESFKGIVESAQRENIKHVFALQDRDFGSSNMHKWHEPNASSVLRIPRHELENYLLDSEAMAGCKSNNRLRSPIDIEGELLRVAESQIFWLAYRDVIQLMRRTILDDFPPPPSIQTITSLTIAGEQLRNSDWYTNLPPKLSSLSKDDFVSSKLRDAESPYRVALQDGSWRTEFSGKEIYRATRSYVYQPPQIPGSPDSDMAADIAVWQRENNRIPQDLIVLRAALQRRVGL